jgi:hypothetical protein
MNEPHDPGRSVAPMTATDLGLRKAFNGSWMGMIFSFLFDEREKDRVQVLKYLFFFSPTYAITILTSLKGEQG